MWKIAFIIGMVLMLGGVFGSSALGTLSLIVLFVAYVMWALAGSSNSGEGDYMDGWFDGHDMRDN